MGHASLTRDIHVYDKDAMPVVPLYKAWPSFGLDRFHCLSWLGSPTYVPSARHSWLRTIILRWGEHWGVQG